MSEKSARLLKEFLQNNNLTQIDFCNATGLSRTSIYKYLRGHRIHPKAARTIEKKILDRYRIFLPHEKLID